MQAENEKNIGKNGDMADLNNNTGGGQAGRPSHFTQLRFSQTKVFVMLLMNLIDQLSRLKY